METVNNVLLSIPFGLGLFLAVVGVLPTLVIVGGWRPKTKTDVMIAAMPPVLGVAGMLCVLAHVLTSGPF